MDRIFWHEQVQDELIWILEFSYLEPVQQVDWKEQQEN
jgi:hypothetical protein